MNTDVSAAELELVRYEGEISSKTPGWELLQEEEGKMVSVPFEGRYESKGGRIQSPVIKLDKAPGEPAYYRLTFRAKTSDHCYWWVDFYDADNNLLPDVNSAVYPNSDREDYDQMVYAQAAATSLRLAFQSTHGVTVRDLAVRQATTEEAGEWGDALYASLPPLQFQPPADSFQLLPKTAAALKEGKTWRVVMLGDSIQNDSFNSVFQALVKRDFPQSQLDFIISVRGSTGCWYYQSPEHFAEYVTRYQPDLLMIGGISNLNEDPDNVPGGMAKIGRVIEQAKTLGCEIVLLSPPHCWDWRPFDAGNPGAPLPAMTWTEATLETKDVASSLLWTPLMELAAKQGIAFWNMTVPTADYVAQSCKPHNYFNRDYIHNNDRGKQIIGRCLQRYFLTA